MSVLSFTTTAPGASADYINYLYAQPVLIDRLGDPTFLDFSLAPVDSSFVKLVRGNYITLSTVSQGIWYTGYIQNDPEIEKLGTKIVAGVPTEVFGYKYEASSDEYILNLKPIGVLPPFFNTTQGAILKRLAAIMAPEVTFDVTNIADGLTVARYVPDQTFKFSDVVKSFCDSGNFRFAAKNHVLTFVQQDTTPATITIDGHDPHFTSADLTLKRTNESIVNDAIVLGDVEPNNYMTEYFVGDGVTARFPLISSVFGADSTLLLDDDFSSTTFDDTKWVIFDEPANFIQLFNGYVNFLGGANDGSYDVHLDGLNQIPLEGNLRITHGEYDFVSASDGVIGGLWTGDAGPTFANCFYGLRATKSGANTVLQPMVNGTVDTTQTLAINYASRYILRTIYSMQSQNRFGQPYSYTDAAGVVHQVSSPTLTDVANVQTFITELDPATGNLLSTHQWASNAVPLSTAQCYGTYVAALSNDLNLTFTGITVSTPMQATLGILPKFRTGYLYSLGMYTRPSIFNGHFYQVTTAGTSSTEPVWPTGSASTIVSGGVTFTEIGTNPKYNPQIVGPNEIDSFDGLTPVASIVDANQGATTRSSKLGTGQYNFGNPALTFFTDSVNLNASIPWAGDIIKCTYRRAAVAMARAQDAVSIALEATAWNDDGLRSIVRGLNGDISPPPRNSSECLVAAQAIIGDLSRQRWDGTYKGTSLYSFTGQPISGTTLTFQNMPSSYPQNLEAEVLQEIQTTFVCSSPTEIFDHQISFGSKDTLKKAVDKFIKKVDLFQQDTTELPPAIDITGIGTAFAPDVLAPELVGWDGGAFSFNINQTAPSGGGFEVRYTDESWGQTPAKNLIHTGAGATFSSPANYRGKVLFIRAFTSDGKFSQYAAGIHVAFPLIPVPPTATLDDTIPTAPIITFALPINQQDVWGVELRTSTSNPNGLVTTPTVLYHSDIIDAAYTTVFTDVNNLSLVMDYNVYTYNLLGQFSDPFNLVVTNPYIQTDSVTGQNLLANAGFEKNLLGLSLNTERLPTQVLVDDWYVHGSLV